ncbi:MAG: iron chelate uptake ABC transporter family permease subunit [Verrucomicrobiota bacterium]
MGNFSKSFPSAVQCVFLLMIGLVFSVCVEASDRDRIHDEGPPRDEVHERLHDSSHQQGNKVWSWLPPGEKVQRVLSFRDHNTRVVFLGLVLLGVVSGITGTFLLLRKRSLLSDSVSHATLPGLAIAFIIFELVTGKGNSLLWLLLGGIVSGLLAMASVIYLPMVSKIKSDAALALSLTFFYGIGVVLLSVIQQIPTANASGLEYFIYGNAATLTTGDVRLIGAVAVVCLLVCLFLFKEFSLLCFDSGYTRTQGYSAIGLDAGLMSLIVLVSVVGLQAVGLLLIMALLIIPAVAARFWAKRLFSVLLVSGLIGGLSCFLGVLLSSLYPRLPTGAIIVLTATSFFVLSQCFGSYRGLAHRWLERRKTQRRLLMQQFLRRIFDVQEKHCAKSLHLESEQSCCEKAEPLDIAFIFEGRSWSRSRFERVVRRAARGGWIRLIEGGMLMLTDGGMRLARHYARQHRLWEIYLIRYADVAPSQVHHDVERIEEVAAPEIVREIENLFDSELKCRNMPAEPHEV